MTAAYGVEGFTPDHLEAFERYGTERVLIAYDRDEAGDRAAEKLAQKLTGKGIACHRIQFPKGMDANAYALKVTPAAKSLGLADPHVGMDERCQWLQNRSKRDQKRLRNGPGRARKSRPNPRQRKL